MGATSKAGVSKLVQAWEAKNNERTKRAAGLGLMAVSLAACGGSDDSDDSDVPVTPPTVTPLSAALGIGVDNVVGTTANDTISGARIDGVQTWNSADRIAAGAGTDTLTAVIAADVTPGAGAVTGVENLVVTGLDNGGGAAVIVTFGDGTDTFISGVTNITNLASVDTQGLTFSRVGQLASVTINNTANPTTVQFENSVLAGSSDTVTLNLSGVGAGAITIGTVADAVGDYETLVINSTGAASDLGAGANNFGTDAATVTINASAALNLGTTARFASANTVDASSSSAAVSLVLADDATAGSNARTVTGGSGNDVLNVSNLVEPNVGVLTVNGGAGNDTINLGGFADDTMVINGGAGTDTLVVTSDILLAESAGISGFETLHTTVDQQMRDFLNNDGIRNFRLTDGDADITQVAAGAVSLQIGGINGAGTPSLARLIDSATDAITIATVAAVTTTSLAIDNEETVTIDAADGALSLGAAAGDGNNDFIAGDMTSLTVTGDNSVTLNDVTSSSVATVNVAGLTAAAAFSASFAASTVAMTVTANSAATGYTGTLTVTTGSGNDVISGTANNDVINGGAGNDRITGGDGDDTITLGAGSDTIVFAATAALNGTDTINGLGGGALVGGGDVLNFAAFLSGGSVEANGGASGAIVAFTALSDTDVNITGKVALFGAAAVIQDGVDADITTTNEVLAALVAEIQGGGNAFSLTAGGKAIVLIGNTTVNTDLSYVVFVDDSLGATTGTVEADDMTIVGVTGTNFDLDTLTTANFAFA